MDSAQYNFKIYQGATWARQCTLKSTAGVTIDLSSYTARLTFWRPGMATPDLVLTSAAQGGIVLAATAPNLSVTITDEQTAAMTLSMSHALEIESAGGVVDSLWYGRATLVHGSPVVVV